jgi:acyl-CoA thioesterase FadM
VTTAVRPEWVDYNGHMSDFRYVQLFGDAMDVLYREVGVDEAYRRAAICSIRSRAMSRTSPKRSAASRLYVTTQILKLDDKRLHVFHRLHRNDDALIATGEQLHLHVDTRPRRPRRSIRRAREARCHPCTRRPACRCRRGGTVASAGPPR